MKSVQARTPKVPTKALPKAPTGINGFDEVTGGGSPRGRTTLLARGMTGLITAKADGEEAELGVRMKSLQVELEAKQVEKALLARTTEVRKGELSRGRTRMGELRGADATVAGRK